MPDESLVHDPLTVAPEPVAVPQEPESAHEQYTTLSEYLESLLVTVILALFGTSFVVQAFKIPSPSMEKTLLVGDHLLVNKFIFGGRGHWYEKLLPYRDLQRGDIIVFKYPYQDHLFFSSRRRHTRYWRDWSSDVCSSDLWQSPAGPGHRPGRSRRGY